jgi:hypothetical protein
MSCKKRRLLLRLVTSRLSRPFSLPATHILIREGSDNSMPVLHRIQQLASLGARRVGHQSSLMRKAAILNRIRIGVRQAAVSRGHVIMADLAARGNALSHGLQLVTTPSSGSMGTRFPAAATGVEMNNANANVNMTPTTAHENIAELALMPPAWRPHTKSFHPPIANHHDHDSVGTAADGSETRYANQGLALHDNYGAAHAGTLRATNVDNRRKDTLPEPPARVLSSAPRYTPPIPDIPPRSLSHTLADVNVCVNISVNEEEDTTAFPAASFHDRYADLSDDDMDDVYADFGVLFGPGARSPEARVVGSPVEEQFFEEYLDELDGIPWVA